MQIWTPWLFSFPERHHTGNVQSIGFKHKDLSSISIHIYHPCHTMEHLENIVSWILKTMTAPSTLEHLNEVAYTKWTSQFLVYLFTHSTIFWLFWYLCLYEHTLCRFLSKELVVLLYCSAVALLLNHRRRETSRHAFSI